MHKVELTFTEKIPLSLNLFAKKKKEKEKNPKPEELINELTISPKTKPFHIRFFQDRKKILDLQLNPFTKLYHREKIPHSPIDIPCYIETHTHTHTYTTYQIPNPVRCLCRISLSCKFHRPISTKQAWKHPTRPRRRTTTTSHRNLYPSPRPDPARPTAIKQSVLARVLDRQENPLFLPPAVFLRAREKGVMARPSVVERVPSEAATRFGSQEDK